LLLNLEVLRWCQSLTGQTVASPDLIYRLGSLMQAESSGVPSELMNPSGNKKCLPSSREEVTHQICANLQQAG
jgi:hypothetical protein